MSIGKGLHLKTLPECSRCHISFTRYLYGKSGGVGVTVFMLFGFCLINVTSDTISNEYKFSQFQLCN